MSLRKPLRVRAIVRLRLTRNGKAFALWFSVFYFFIRLEYRVIIHFPCIPVLISEVCALHK